MATRARRFQGDKLEVRGTITGKFLSGASLGFAGDAPDGMTAAIQGKPTYNYLEFLLKSDRPIKPGQSINLLVANKEGRQSYACVVSYDPSKPMVTEITPASGKQASTNLSIRIKGTGFIPGWTTVNLGNGVSALKTEVKSGAEIVLTINIDQNATLGKRKVKMFNGGAFSEEKTFEITAP